MANKFTKALSAFLAVIMCLGAMNLAVLAETLDTDKTVWLGDGLSAVVAPGKGGYDFLSVFREPAHAYEISNHVLNDGNGNAIPQTLVLVETKDEEYTWTPNGEYSLDANYEVLYCCDAITGYADGVNYKRLNLEDSDYYSPESAAHIRSIITNSYPYVSLEEMKANLVDAGVDGAADLTRADIIAGVQAAVWYFANGNSDYDYLRSYNVAATPGYGKVMHDFTGEMSAEIQALGNRKTLVDAEAGARVEALADYLKGLTGTYVPRDKMIITKLDIVKATPHANASGVYSSTIRIDLNSSGTSQNDNIKIDIYVNGEVVKTRNIELGKTSYDITLDAKLGDEIKAVLSGTQIIPEGVYFYEPEGGREVSQCLVGVASGETSVYADAEMKVTDTPFGGDKVATPLDKNAQTDVTLSVPGEAEMIHTVCEGSYVEDHIGYEEGKGNFEFMTDKENIKLTVGKETYITTVVEEFNGETASYAFTKPGADEATFWLDYYYGNGKTTERFVWTFGEDVSTENNVALTYKLQLTEMAEDLGDHQVDANLSATLYPPKNPEEEADPAMFVIFPVPTVDYTVSEAPENFTVSFKSGEASNISFMLIDEATGEVEFLEKIDIGGETSFDIPSETGKISAVFVKQSTSGMFWFAEDVDADVVDATIACLKANNPSYKGYNAIAFGEGAHELEFKNNKFVTYIFEGDAVASDEKDDVIVEVEKDDVAEDVVVDSSESKNNGNKNKNKNKNK